MRFAKATCVALLAGSLLFGCGKKSGNGSVKVDTSDPKAAVRTMLEAMINGDERALFAAVTVPDNMRPMLSAMMANARAMKELEEAFVDKYGQEAWDGVKDEVGGPPDDAMEDIERDLERAEVNIDGDTATVTVDGDDVTLRREGGDWKVDLVEMIGEPDSDEDIQENIQVMERMTQVANQLIEGVESGEITAENFEQSFGQAMMQAVISGTPEMSDIPMPE